LTFIAKPNKGSGGNGIKLIQEEKDMPSGSSEYVIQKYLENPLLIDGKKFDLRLYIVLKGVTQVDVYLC
jgi:hypothetical protein